MDLVPAPGTEYATNSIDICSHTPFMHELSITQGLLQIVLEEASKHSISKVSVVKLRIGQLTGVEPLSLSFCFELLTKDTLAEGADLQIDMVPIKRKCPNCLEVFETDNFSFVCPACSSVNTELITGRELYVEQIEGD